MMWQAALVLATVSFLSGCLVTPEGETVEDLPAEGGNLWEAGLAGFYETPPHVRLRDAAERTVSVASPGDPRFVQFDLVMEGFMVAYEVPAAQLALMQDGHLIYASGYG